MLNHFTFLLLYFGLCWVIALLGKNRKWGFWGYLWSSVFLSPLFGFLFLLASDPKPDR